VGVSSPSFRVLGPVDALRDGQPLTLGSGTRLTLLAGMLISANQTVSVQALADLLWEARSPVHPRTAVQTGISRLRRRLGPDVVETVAGAYRIRVAPDDLDLLKFSRLVEVADQQAGTGAEDALAALDAAKAPDAHPGAREPGLATAGVQGRPASAFAGRAGYCRPGKGWGRGS
jgi:DNA-binding SARP family transcriptional activator